MGRIVAFERRFDDDLGRAREHRFQPLFLAGTLDIAASLKAARFIRFCDCFNIPIISFVDVTGYLPGTAQEYGGIITHGAKLVYAYAEATVPKITVILRKAFGGAYIAMNSRALGATAVFAWPGAEIAVMGAGAAVNILHRKKLAAARPEEREALRTQLVEEQTRVAGGVSRAVEIGVVDEVIRPERTRRRIAEAVAAAPAARGAHGNIPL